MADIRHLATVYYRRRGYEVGTHVCIEEGKFPWRCLACGQEWTPSKDAPAIDPWTEKFITDHAHKEGAGDV